jgi:hypothetical protein
LATTPESLGTMHEIRWQRLQSRWERCMRFVGNDSRFVGNDSQFPRAGEAIGQILSEWAQYRMFSVDGRDAELLSTRLSLIPCH